MLPHCVHRTVSTHRLGIFLRIQPSSETKAYGNTHTHTEEHKELFSKYEKDFFEVLSIYTADFSNNFKQCDLFGEVV